MQRSWQFISLLLISIMTLTGCQSTYYSAMEKIGFEKRDILYSRVKDAKESQKDAQKEFESAYEEFSALINFDGGDLEKTYNRLKKRYDNAVETAENVTEKRQKVESVGKALFNEWSDEIELYSNQTLEKRKGLAQYILRLTAQKNVLCCMVVTLDTSHLERSQLNEDAEWNIVSIGSRDTSHKRSFKTGAGSVALNCVSRTRIPDSTRVGNSIAGPWDYIVDLTSPPSTLDRGDFSTDRGGMDQNRMFRARGKKPLLLIYLIDPNSKPRASGRGSNREPLFEDSSGKEPVVGIAMVLPSANITRKERNREREYYIRIGAATIEDVLSKRT